MAVPIVAFTSSTYATADMNLGGGYSVGYVAAFRIAFDTDSSIYVAADGTSNTHWRIDENATASWWRQENNEGSPITTPSFTVPAVDGSDNGVSVFINVNDVSTNSCNVYANSTTVLGESDDADAAVGVKLPKYLNNTDAAGANAAAFHLIGGLWVGTDADIEGSGIQYSDFFDGSNQPTSAFQSATVSGVTSTFYNDNTAADWINGINDGTGAGFTFTGTPTDVGAAGGPRAAPFGFPFKGSFGGPFA